MPLLNHHTSGVRKDFYRSEEDLAKDAIDDPFPKLKKLLYENGISDEELEKIEAEAAELIDKDFMKALNSPEPDTEKAIEHVFVPTTVTEEKGERFPAGKEKVIMVDAALFAIRELMEDHPECIFFGQDVAGLVPFSWKATLAEQFAITVF